MWSTYVGERGTGTSYTAVEGGRWWRGAATTGMRCRAIDGDGTLARGVEAARREWGGEVTRPRWGGDGTSPRCLRWRGVGSTVAEI
jgi:hypothetical protein